MKLEGFKNDIVIYVRQVFMRLWVECFGLFQVLVVMVFIVECIVSIDIVVVCDIEYY